MKNIEKYNKYFGQKYEVKKIVYFAIILILVIMFFFHPSDIENSLTDQVNTQENIPPIVQSQDKQSNEQKIIENQKENEKSGNKDNKSENDLLRESKM